MAAAPGTMETRNGTAIEILLFYKLKGRPTKAISLNVNALYFDRLLAEHLRHFNRVLFRLRFSALQTHVLRKNILLMSSIFRLTSAAYAR